MSKKKILTGHVARIIDGVLVSAGPGDVAPDWVTNPALFAEGDATPAVVSGVITAEQVEAGSITVENPAPSPASTDDLSALGIKELRKLAEEAGVAKSGSKEEIANRLRAKRDADAEAANNDAENDTRDELVAKAAALGAEGAENMTDAELAAVVEQGE